MSEKAPNMRIEDLEEKRARGEGLRDDEREAYNKAQSERKQEEFIEGGGPMARAIERETAGNEARKREAGGKLQHRSQQVEGFIENHKAQIESLAKEIASLNEKWSKTDPERHLNISFATKIKEDMKKNSEKELGELLKERDNIQLEIQKLEY